MAATRATSVRLTRSKSKVLPTSPDDSKSQKLDTEYVVLDPGTEDHDKTTSFNGQLSKFQFAFSTAEKLEQPSRSPLKRVASELEPVSRTSSPAKKKQRTASRYAPPSKYAHLKPLTDILAPNLIAVFVGTNPGIQTATAGHAYAHPSNSFWKMLHASELTDRRLKPEEDETLPEKYQLGNTNIVSRPSKDAAELSKEELAAGTPILEEKFAKWRPEAVCIVGKGIWESVWRWRYGRGFKKGEFEYGWQDETENMGRVEDWDGARVYVTTSTSGLAASMRPHEKEAIWRPFGEWVVKRRKERENVVKSNGDKEAGGDAKGESVGIDVGP